ncbi:glutathione S-transferase Mu 4-like [Palaemon carinicauda]|uniref:glutathione S-transferase Mu 4-like n=1 Tax=Palaemon carinicauda TaxID=392227 RepID=UPI0035B6502E
MAPVLAYWTTRCLAQPIRLLLKYTETEFVDKRYPVGPAPDYDKKEWRSDKITMGLDFPNLPYYIDDDVRITQSKAILRYLGWKHDLCGNTAQERARIEMLAEQANDVHWEFIVFTYDHYDDEQKKKDFMSSLPGKFQAFSNFLGERRWFAGDNISYADFLTYEVLDQHLHLDPNCLKEFKNLQDFLTRFEELPAIRKYMASAEFLRTPLNNKYAKFGNK